MKFEILITDGRWTINGKKFNQLSFLEKETLNRFFQNLKYEQECEENGTYSRVGNKYNRS